MKNLFFAAIAALLSFAAQAQRFDTIRVDTSTYPGPTYVRINFPHSGFKFKNYTKYDMNSYPPLTYCYFLFDECEGQTGNNFYDTTITLYVDHETRLSLWLFLDTNTTNTNCVQRNSQIAVDSVWIDYFTASMSVEDRKGVAITIYPNPTTNNRLTVEVSKVSSTLTTAILYSLQGSSICTYQLQSNKAEIELPASLKSGTYLIQLRLANGEIIRERITLQ